MTEDNNQTNNLGAAGDQTTDQPTTPAASPEASQGNDSSGAFDPKRRNSRFGGNNNRRGGGDRKPRREPRAKPEFDQKIIDIRRVTRVASGGRRFSFSVALVAGNRKGKVGVGTGKAGDTSLAIEKALKNAKKNMIDVSLTKSMSIPYEIQAKYCSSRVEMLPAKGKGIAAGSSVRDVIELAGINDVVAKLRSGTKNKLNNARVAIKALEMIR